MRGAVFLCVFSALLIFTPTASAGLFGPSNYYECIAPHMKKGDPASVPDAILNQCNEEFSKQLPSDVSKNIEARIVSDYYGYNYMIAIHNNNQHWILTSITIRLTCKNDKTHRDYLLYAFVLPLSDGDSTILTKPPKSCGATWNVQAETGYSN